MTSIFSYTMIHHIYIHYYLISGVGHCWKRINNLANQANQANQAGWEISPSSVSRTSSTRSDLAGSMP